MLLFPFRRSLFLMCYDVFTRCASYFEVFYYSYMNSFYGKMEVDFMTQWQPSTFTPDKTADTAAYAASLSASATSQSLNRTFLSSLFEQIFNFPSEALSLYNAINGTNYSDPGLLTITTLSGALFLGYRNDCPELKISLNFFLKLVAFLMISGNGLHLRLILIPSSNGPEMPRAVRI